MISEKRFKEAVEEFNDLMIFEGKARRTIGTKYSRGTEDWNLRDMVSECQCALDRYSQEGTTAWYGLYCIKECKATLFDWLDHETSRILATKIITNADAKARVKNLQNYIEQYGKDVKGMKCNAVHDSFWDETDCDDE